MRNINSKVLSTDLCIADNFQAVWMKDSTKSLIEFVKLVNLPGHPVVPQHSVTEDEVVRGVEGCPVPGVGVAVGRRQSPQPLTSVEIPDGGHAVRAGPHHLVLHQLGELQELLLSERHFLLEELPDGPDLAVGQPPAGAGDDEIGVVAGLDVVDAALMALVGRLLSAAQVEHLHVAQDGPGVEELPVSGEGGAGEDVVLAILGLRPEGLHRSEPGVDQLPVQLLPVRPGVWREVALATVAGSEVERSVAPGPFVRALK